MDQRALYARVEAASLTDFAELVLQPSAEEERALRAYFGDERYQNLHAMALRQNVRARRPDRAHNVVVLHGIMGSELAEFVGADRQPVWLHLLRLANGHFERLRLSEDGRSESYDIRPTGILKRHYGELLLSLMRSFNVRAFWYDWRKDLRVAAAELQAKLTSWFPEDACVHLLAHSMGGLVARTFIAQYPERWRQLRDRGARLVMLGTPNLGSYIVPQVLTGVESIVRWLALLDVRNRQATLLSVLASFPGLYQLLPAPGTSKVAEALYDPKTYGDLNVSRALLQAARESHLQLQDVSDREHMVNVVGDGYATFDGIDPGQLGSLATRPGPERARKAYTVTLRGDGRVPHSLGVLAGVPTYVVQERHGSLPRSREVLDGLEELLRTGRSTTLPTLREGAPGERGGREAVQRLEERVQLTDAAFQTHCMRMAARGARDASTERMLGSERLLEEMLWEGDSIAEGLREEPRPPRRRAGARPPLQLRVSVVHDSIATVHQHSRHVDAIAVGHYLGGRPTGTLLVLDRALSRALAGGDGGSAHAPHGLLLTQYAERGVLRGELAQPFFLPDPRSRPGRGAQPRVIAVVGLGLPGQCGAPELAVAVRELCWSIARMGKRHLATVLIGSGRGNLAVREAVHAWVRGFQQAFAGVEGAGSGLERITFVESARDRVLEIREELEALGSTPLPGDRLRLIHEKGVDAPAAVREPPEDGWEGPQGPTPTRVTISAAGQHFRFGGVTPDAAIPERDVVLDPRIVEQANDQLAAAADRRTQRDRGRLLEKLLVPSDIRRDLSTKDPLVMVLDATTARLHWELVAQSDPLARDGSDDTAGDSEEMFLGIGRSLTRQLRTTFAPPPEPPPPPRRVLRVLVVADPAADARLPGAEAEGAEVAALFEHFNTVYRDSGNRVEVERLLGPSEATHVKVLEHLLLHRYDVLHFAGHCVYDRSNPAASGWLFSRGVLLTANELGRIDRVPSFIFSNACESGITPDRSSERSAALPPAFAEAFFARGVSNLVCTGWPVDDLAARWFALVLYQGLLGLGGTGPGEEGWAGDGRDGGAALPELREPTRSRTLAMHEAMRVARRELRRQTFGMRSWGAYQHYGNPFFRFFEAPAQPSGEREAPHPEPRPRARRRSARSHRDRPAAH